MSMTLERGALLHKRYRIVEILGQGGMGSVYRAVDENLGVDVAVKENLFTSDEYARQFRLEAVILANLRHTNLPRVTDHFVIGEQGQYLIMDYIEGEDLRQRMERVGSITEEDAILVGAAMCDALQYLHTRKPSIIHRDVKPGNVRIAPDGHIYLVDFGLAKLVKGSQATTTGARAMTPGYSPPEQYGTARTDPRTDIYSLGATLYAALTGVIPEDALARAMDNVELTPLRKRNPKISRRLANAVEKAMAIHPEERFQTADEFKQALVSSNVKTQRLEGEFVVDPPPQEGKEEENLSKELPPEEANPSISHPPSRPRRKKGWSRNWWVFTSFSLLAILAAILVVIFWPRSASPLPTTPITSTPLFGNFRSTATSTKVIDTATLIPRPSLTPTHTLIAPLLPSLTSTPTPTAGPTSTPFGGNGGQIAFASDRTGIPQIFLVNPDGNNLIQITHISGGACQPDWSPDGLHIVFISPCPGRLDNYPGAKLYIINVDGGGLVQLPSVGLGDFDPAWSPDGKSIAFTVISSTQEKLDQIYLMRLPNYQVMQLTTKSADLTMPDWSHQPAWSPDGSKIAYSAHSLLTDAQQIWVMNSDGNQQTRLVRRDPSYWEFLPTWSPDGKTILFSETKGAQSLGWLMSYDFQNRETAEAIYFRTGAYANHADYSPDGQWIVVEGLDVSQQKNKAFSIFLMAAAPGNYPTFLVGDSQTNFGPAWRP
ncbi:MAG TPA: protein kinase [Anaerolineales bacterium]|nr:protein kinase [Anaerolineales bacterium]